MSTLQYKLSIDNSDIKWQVGKVYVQVSSDLRVSVGTPSNSNNSINMFSESKNSKPFTSIISNEIESTSWIVDLETPTSSSIRGPFGVGHRLKIKAVDSISFSNPISLILDLEVYDKYPNTLFTRSYFDSKYETKIDKVIMNRILVDPMLLDGESKLDAWSYSGSGETREHHIQALTEDYYKRNYLGLLESFDGGGHNADYRCGSQPGYGGGVPLVDIWSRGGGIAIGHSDVSFRYVNLPVEVKKSDGVELSMSYNPRFTLKPNNTLVSYSGFVTLHNGDYFNPLDTYRRIMTDQGMKFDKSVSGSYEPQWDTWGFNADFSMDDVRETLPYLKEIGIKWLTLDDRWFDVNGDWMPRLDTFPGGEQDLIDFIKELHDGGFKVRLWTIPGEFDGKPDLDEWQKQHPTAAIELAKHPYHAESEFYKSYKDMMISSPYGNLEYSKRGNYFGAGNLPEVQKFFKELTKKMFNEWKIDGLKQDAVYMAPQDYNPNHHLSNPDEAGDGYSAIMKVIFETAMEYNPDAVILNCPCGTPMTPQWIEWQNQAVTVDPWTSWVNRGVFKEMKGLFGATAPVVIDHIEISDEGDDFSLLGIGGVPATRFTPSGRDKTNEIEDRIFEVRPFEEKLELWKHWFNIYNKMRLSEGVYLNLYDLIYDKPETHVIQKDKKLYYSLYPGEPDGIVDDGGVEYRIKKDTKVWKGTFTFKGLDHTVKYSVRDWENDIDFGIVSGDLPTIILDIKHHLLLELIPIKNN